MFKIVKRNEKGFTLIELMIVIAIIGVLAAIAIPQFSAYRAKSYNSAAEMDVKNFITTETTCFQDNQAYALVASTTGAATGTIGATPSTYGISNGVTLQAVIDATGSAFNVSAKHLQGTRDFAADSDATAVFWNASAAGTAAVAPIAAVADADEYTGVGTWTAL